MSNRTIKIHAALLGLWFAGRYYDAASGTIARVMWRWYVRYKAGPWLGP